MAQDDGAFKVEYLRKILGLIFKAAIMTKMKIACRQSVLIIFLLLVSVIAFSQNNFTVNGKITDEGNKPLEGVTVQVRGTKTVTLTKKDGTFSIAVPSATSVLVVSSVGFREQEI